MVEEVVDEYLQPSWWSHRGLLLGSWWEHGKGDIMTQGVVTFKMAALRSDLTFLFRFDKG